MALKTWFLLLQVERARHVLLLREKLQEQNKTQELSKLDKEASNMFKQARCMREKEAELSEKEKDNRDDKGMENTERWMNLSTEADRDKELISRCLKLMLQGRIPQQPYMPKVGAILQLSHHSVHFRTGVTRHVTRTKGDTQLL